MAGLYTGAPGLWGGLPGLISSTTLSTPPSLLANVGGIAATGANLALWFDENQAYKSSGGGIVTPDSILTYTAPSPKLVYGSDGVLGYAPHNLLLRSEEFNESAWTKGDATITANAVAAPDGTMTADKLVEAATLASHFAFQTTASSVTSGATYTQTVYAKAAERSWLRVFLGANIGNGLAWVNLATGAVGTTSGSPTVVVTDVGNGWYRIAVSKAATGTGATSISFLMGTSDGGDPYTGNGTSGVFIWGAQLNLGSSALTYIPTTTAAVYSLPRDYNPTTGAALGVLVEEARTNLLTYSQQFDNAAWVKSRATVTGASINAIIAPDGTMTADKIVPSVDNATHRIYQRGITHGVLRTYAYTCYLKAGEYTFARLLLADSTESDTASCRFNLSDGTLDGVAAASGTFSSASASVVDVGNGWYRCTLIATCDATEATLSAWVWSGSTTAGANTFAGDGTSGIYAWGAQLEAGAFATSYIPTVASQVTRAADQISILTSAFPYSATAGTVAVEAQVPSNVDSGNGNYFFSISDGTISNLIHIAEINGVRSQIVSGAAVQFDSTVGAEPATDVLVKAAVGYATNDMRLARGGSLGVADTSGTVPSGITILRIAVRGDASFTTYLNGHIKRLAYYASRKDNATLQVLTA